MESYSFIVHLIESAIKDKRPRIPTKEILQELRYHLGIDQKLRNLLIYVPSKESLMIKETKIDEDLLKVKEYNQLKRMLWKFSTDAHIDTLRYK